MHPENNIIGIPQKHHLPDEYPENWKEIANNLKKSTAYRCQNCGHINDPTTGYQITVHHKNGIKSDCRPENLAVLCQRCHLIEQSKLRLLQRKIEQEIRGQNSLFPVLSENRKKEYQGQMTI